MYRVRSTDLWFNAPGVVAAYQPVAAPDSLAARQNAGNDLRMAGRHTAQPGVLPTHDPRTGWLHTGSDLWLSTGVTVDPANMTVLISLSNSSLVRDGRCIGSSSGNWYLADYFGVPRFANGGAMNGVGNTKTCVLAMSGQVGYFNGLFNVNIPTGPGLVGSGIIYIGRAWYVERYAGNILSVMISSRLLAPAHIWQYSRQMAYCHLNPGWSAWGRRRRYYYAPSAAAGIIWRGVGRNSSPVGGSPGIGRST